MSKPQYLKSKSITAMLIAVVVMFIPSSLFAQSTSTYSEYAAKFLCGMNQSTDISVHNPNLFTTDNPLSFLKKAVLSLSEGTTPVPPSAFKQDTLANDYAEMITCGTIRSLLGSAAPPAPAFIEGYVVIIVPPASNPNELDVTAVYTVGSKPVTGVQIVPVSARIITPPPAGAAVETKLR